MATFYEKCREVATKLVDELEGDNGAMFAKLRGDRDPKHTRTGYETVIDILGSAIERDCGTKAMGKLSRLRRNVELFAAGDEEESADLRHAFPTTDFVLGSFF